MAKKENEGAAPDQRTEKLKALQAAMEKIEKDFGKGSIMKLGEDRIDNIEVIPSGSIALDYALGVGGYPKGRIVEIYGPESSGKTTLAIHAIAEAQKQGGIAAFIDAEHAFDRFYAANLGVNVDELLISQPDNGEQALDIADQLIRSAAVDIIVIDSVAALTPKAELEGDMGENKVGLQARLMSQALRKLTATINKTKTIANKPDLTFLYIKHYGTCSHKVIICLCRFLRIIGRNSLGRQSTEIGYRRVGSESF